MIAQSLYLINQPMSLERRQMTSHQSRDHRHRQSDKVNSNMPIEAAADCATAASTNTTTEGKGLSLATSSSCADKKQIAALVASNVTIATEASSLASSIGATSNNTRDNGIDIENRFLRPRMKELHHHNLAMNVVIDLDNDDDDDTISESSNHDGTTDEVQGFQAEDDVDDNQGLFLSSLEEGLKFMHRPRKSEKHIYALSQYLLDDEDDDEYKD